MIKKIDEIKIVKLPKILDDRGNLSFLEEYKHVPFEIKRTYWIYDVPGGESRGGHSYRINEELIIALSGSFDVILTDGYEVKRVSLNRSYFGLYVPNGIWRHMENFSTNSLAFIAASTEFDEADYERDLDKFKNNGKYI
ncbi:sugar 3,4-ketoisomerase [Pedobacter endophyticus]|uniref:WxcM-like domain-containing protein n=1 Tax=Pedobacter endophyticus TaxID=2789740 RepID=A0A7U3Q646_9SPHI|nr:FdtA/QdtA family cupin domain-containing protein [Pedobacter endophyticus]QPH38345.1 WxcM-like domain-containing protein [Pedobacter endophyticus]